MGTTKNTVRKTTGVLRGEGPWHSVNSDIYPNHPNCQTGNRIEPENLRQGTANKQRCEECDRLNNADGPLGNLTNL
jgi:hypothetical protein